MRMNEYQGRAKETSIYREGIADTILSAERRHLEEILRVNYCALKVAGEAGEIAETVGKALRDGYAQELIYPHGEFRIQIISELGDLLWEFSQLCEELSIDMEEVAKANLNKLKSRQERGVLGGSGSDR